MSYQLDCLGEEELITSLFELDKIRAPSEKLKFLRGIQDRLKIGGKALITVKRGDFKDGMLLNGQWQDYTIISGIEPIEETKTHATYVITKSMIIVEA